MAKINKIIIFNEAPFCQRDYDRFGIKILQQNGFEVEVWEFMPMLHPSTVHLINVPDPINFPGHRKILNFQDFKSAVSGLDKNCFVISILNYRFDTYKIFRVISLNNIRYCMSAIGSSYPGCAAEVKDIKRKKRPAELLYGIVSALRKISKLVQVEQMSKNCIFYRVPFKLLGIKPTNLILADAAFKLPFCYYPMNKDTEILRTHYFDYDIYLEEIKESYQINENIGVFLDEYLPHHPDFYIAEIPNPITPESYYPYLCEFFDYIENKFNVEIIVAAHPRSHYERHEDYFKGRKVIRGQTIKLVRKAGFVLAHQSYSINYAVLFKKPVVFITNNKINSTFMKVLMERMANAIGKTIINIDEPLNIDWHKELFVDENRYADYRRSYIKQEGTEELPLWQIVANRIKSF